MKYLVYCPHNLHVCCSAKEWTAPFDVCFLTDNCSGVVGGFLLQVAPWGCPWAHPCFGVGSWCSVAGGDVVFCIPSSCILGHFSSTCKQEGACPYIVCPGSLSLSPLLLYALYIFCGGVFWDMYFPVRQAYHLPDHIYNFRL